MADYQTSVELGCESGGATLMLLSKSKFAVVLNEPLAENITAVLLRGQLCQRCSSGSFAVFAHIASRGRTVAFEGRTIRFV